MIVLVVAANYGDTGSDHAVRVDIPLLDAIFEEFGARGLWPDYKAVLAKAAEVTNLSLLDTAIRAVVKRQGHTLGGIMGRRAIEVGNYHHVASRDITLSMAGAGLHREIAEAAGSHIAPGKPGPIADHDFAAFLLLLDDLGYRGSRRAHRDAP